MPDLGILCSSTPPSPYQFNPKSSPIEPCDSDSLTPSHRCDEDNQVSGSENQIGKIRVMNEGNGGEEYLKRCIERGTGLGLSGNGRPLSFLVSASKSVVCRACSLVINSSDKVSCRVRGCPGVYHRMCAKENFGCVKKFKCSEHACFVCKQKFSWRCIRCGLASHDRCAPWPDKVIHLNGRSGWVICWRHPKDWRLDKKLAVPSSNIEEIFSFLPLPYVEEEFVIDSTLKGNENHDIEEIFHNLPLPYVHEEFRIDSPLKASWNSEVEMPSYVRIRRNVYLVKKRRDSAFVDNGCSACDSTCGEDCVCRVQCISCSRDCGCTEICTNRPFRKEKQITVVKTKLCGWGVEAAESINEGDFIIEYVGEVIDDVLCEQRLWDMKYKGINNFYLCEIAKNFVIDATIKGNASRFLNHSCVPNCRLEKWQVEGETRVGVFAARAIKVGEPLTYDYRFVRFGPEVKCHCGAVNCQGYLGMKKKSGLPNLCWGSKRKRSLSSSLLY